MGKGCLLLPKYAGVTHISPRLAVFIDRDALFGQWTEKVVDGDLTLSLQHGFKDSQV